MRIIFFATIVLYFMALLFDIIYMRIHIDVLKVISQISLTLASLGSLYYAIKNLRKRKK